MTTSTKFYAKKSASNEKRGEMFIYDYIGMGVSMWDDGISSRSVAEALKDVKGVDELDIYLNSGGGIVNEGIAIYNQLMRFQARKVVHIDGFAASIASVIALCGDERRIASNAQFMIHEPMGFFAGKAEEIRAACDALDLTHEQVLDTYVARTGSKRPELDKLMRAETWMGSKESLERGFATSIVEDKVAVMAWSPLFDRYRHVPPQLLSLRGKAPQATSPEKKEPPSAKQRAYAARVAALQMAAHRIKHRGQPQPA